MSQMFIYNSEENTLLARKQNNSGSENLLFKKKYQRGEIKHRHINEWNFMITHVSTSRGNCYISFLGGNRQISMSTRESRGGQLLARGLC